MPTHGQENDPVAYWHRTAPHTFTPTEHVGGSWDLATQHIAPALGVLAHEVERDRTADHPADQGGDPQPRVAPLPGPP